MQWACAINWCLAFWSWVGLHAPSLGVTFCYTSSIGLTVLFSQLMRWRTQVEWRAQSGWKRGVWCSTHAGSWLFGCGGVCHRRHCVRWPGCTVLLAFFVDFFRCLVESSWRMGLTGWWCCGRVLALPSGPASCPLITHLWPHPCSGRDWMRLIFISWMSFHVVYKVICAPPSR